MSNLRISKHPVVADRLARLRPGEVSTEHFRAYIRQISYVLACEASAELPTCEQKVVTPLCETFGRVLANRHPVLLVPVLRAGTGLMEGFETLFPDHHVGHIGLYRDEETHKPVEYLVRLPAELERPIFLLDPMLATGNSTAKAIDILLERGAKIGNIRAVTLIAAPEGVKLLQERFPGLVVHTASLDSHLNERAFIVPGLGDAGDRLCGTI